MLRIAKGCPRLFCFASLVALTACTSSTQPAASNAGPAAASSSSTAPSVTTSQDDFDACSMFSAADAQNVMGAPMKPSPISRPKRVCMYVEVAAKPNSMGPGSVTLTVNKRKSQEDENRAWSNLKVVRHLQTGEKNVQALSGIGDEAWFDGHIEKGKVGVASIVARKGASDFMLDNMVIEYRASPDTLKAIAKRVAGQL